MFGIYRVNTGLQETTRRRHDVVGDQSSAMFSVSTGMGIFHIPRIMPLIKWNNREKIKYWVSQLGTATLVVMVANVSLICRNSDAFCSLVTIRTQHCCKQNNSGRKMDILNPLNDRRRRHSDRMYCAKPECFIEVGMRAPRYNFATNN